MCSTGAVRYLVVRVDYATKEDWLAGRERARSAAGLVTRQAEATRLARRANMRLQTVAGYHRWAVGHRDAGLAGAALVPGRKARLKQLHVPGAQVLPISLLVADGRCDECRQQVRPESLYRISIWDQRGQYCYTCLAGKRTLRALALHAWRRQRTPRWQVYVDLLIDADLAERDHRDEATALQREAREAEAARRERQEREEREARQRAEREVAAHRLAEQNRHSEAEARERRQQAREARRLLLAARVKRRSVKGAERAFVVVAYKQACAYCHRGSESAVKDPDGKTWHIDHILPISRGGDYDLANLALSCKRCNHRKSAKEGVRVKVPAGMTVEAFHTFRLHYARLSSTQG